MHQQNFEKTKAWNRAKFMTLSTTAYLQLPVDLLGPDDGSGDGRQVAHRRHARGLAVRVLDLELGVQSLDVVLDSLL